MSEIREKIINYLKVKTRLDIAATRIVNEKLQIENTAIHYGLITNYYNFLIQKVEILERLNDYFEESLLYENAVRSVMYNYKTLPEAERYFKLSSKIIKKEIDQYNKLHLAGKTKGPYEYDKPLNDKGRVFTFKEELSLMDDLRDWKWKCTSPCTCLICAMIQLLSLAYQFAQKKNKSYPSTWDFYQRADENWLIAFEMAHSCRLSKLYPQCNNVEEFFETCKNKQQPSSLDNERNIFKIPSSTQNLQKRKLNNSLNIDKASATTSDNKTSTVVQNNQDTNSLMNLLDISNVESNNAGEIACANFPNDQFENIPAPVCSQINSDNKTSTVVQNNQDTNSLMNLLDISNVESNNAREIACANFPYDQFENIPAPVCSQINSDNKTSTVVQNNQDTNSLMNLLDISNVESNNAGEIACANFPYDQFENIPAPVCSQINSTKQFDIRNNISQKENFDPSQAYNAYVTFQNTNMQCPWK